MPLLQKTLPKPSLLIAGPCSMENREQMVAILEMAKKYGVQYIRTQVFKPRTNPDSFQGLAQEGIEILKELKELYREQNFKFVCEVGSEQHLLACKDIADILQIGARNMQNFELLKAISQHWTELNAQEIILKRGFANTYKEWIFASNYLLNPKAKLNKDHIILCERGSRSFTSPTDVTLDFIMALKAKGEGFRVIIDPSHGSRHADYVLPLATAAIAMDFEGIMIEVHPDPEKSVSDAMQALSIEQFSTFLEKTIAL